MKGLFILILMVGILLSGCGPKCPECPDSSSYSACDDQAMKTRTNYKCSESTEFQCESFQEEKQCATEIKLSGHFSGTVSSSVEEKVKGVIKIEVNPPADTKIVAYFLEGGDLEPIGQGRMPFFATDQGDVWTGMIDTAEYENGLYTLGVVSNDKEEMEGPPKAFASGQILIDN
ncbi:hypothetical protein ACFL0V_01245 [Nanoarchaeota archaeon]